MRAKYLLAVVACAMGLYALPAHAGPSTQPTILAGYDLLSNTNTTLLDGYAFQGDPTGNYNFGLPYGMESTFCTDTIVQRLSDASITGDSGSNPSVEFILSQLDLVSTTPLTIYGHGGYFYITLQSQDGTGPASTGQMTINWNTPTSGTFSSSLDVYFDMHYGTLDGPIVKQDNVTLTSYNRKSWMVGG